jgi:hypothetical protein
LPDRSEREKQRHFVTQELNKLTMTNFSLILDNFTKNPAFETTPFLEMLADGLFEAAILQPLFSDLYSFFAYAVMRVLNHEDNHEDNAEFRKISGHFVERLRSRVLTLFDADLSSSSDVCLGHASFLGCLAARPPLIDLDIVFRGAGRLLQPPVTAVRVEVCGKLVIPCGRLIDARYGEDANRLLFDKLKALSGDRSLPGSVRYFLVDILQARAKAWDTHALLNQIHGLTTARPARPARPAREANAKSPPPRIAAGKNTFAGLESDSDEEYSVEEEEAGDFDATTMIKEFLVDKTLAKAWRPDFLDQLMIAIAQFPDVGRAVRIIRALHEADLLDAARSVQQLGCVVRECMRPEVRADAPAAVAACGAILARLVEVNAATVDDFGAVFPAFELGAVSDFLDQIVEARRVGNVRESGYWMDYRWRPDEGVSHLGIGGRLNEALLELFPLYDSLLGLQAMFADGASVDDIVEEVAQLPEDVAASAAFAAGVAELLLRGGTERPGWERLLEPVRERAAEILAFAEFFGIQNNWQAEQFGDAIKALIAAGRLDPTAYFARQDLGPRHAEIVALVT